MQFSAIQAKFANFRDEEIKLRQKIGARYSEALKDYVTVPAIHAGKTHIYAQYTIRPKNRDSLPFHPHLSESDQDRIVEAVIQQVKL